MAHEIKHYIGCNDDIGDGYSRMWLTDIEVIFCRDCKKMDEIQQETNQPCSTEPDGFCKWAERRDA